jgi:hypothetical protein
MKKYKIVLHADQDYLVRKLKAIGKPIHNIVQPQQHYTLVTKKTEDAEVNKYILKKVIEGYIELQNDIDEEQAKIIVNNAEWSKIREIRNSELFATDWVDNTKNMDAKLSAKMSSYRQALRDITKQDKKLIVWPIKPKES